MKFREITLPSGTKVFLGKNAENNDELMKKFRGKNNVILHTSEPGSPFCVIEKESPSRADVKVSGAICARFSQDWRDNKRDVAVNVFTGKDVSKSFWLKKGMWKVRKSKSIRIKKSDISKFERKGNKK